MAILVLAILCTLLQMSRGNTINKDGDIIIHAHGIILRPNGHIDISTNNYYYTVAIRWPQMKPIKGNEFKCKLIPQRKVDKNWQRKMKYRCETELCYQVNC